MVLEPIDEGIGVKTMSSTVTGCRVSKWVDALFFPRAETEYPAFDPKYLVRSYNLPPDQTERSALSALDDLD